MSDRELLEKAAKAAGMPCLVWGEKYMVGDTEVDCSDLPYVPSDSPDEAPAYWNPLTDDADALRLAVKLGISLDRAVNRCWAFRAGMAMRGVCEEFYGPDPYAATRRAIVRAAAAMADANGDAA